VSYGLYVNIWYPLSSGSSWTVKCLSGTSVMSTVTVEVYSSMCCVIIGQLAEGDATCAVGCCLRSQSGGYYVYSCHSLSLHFFCYSLIY